MLILGAFEIVGGLREQGDTPESARIPKILDASVNLLVFETLASTLLSVRPVALAR